MKMTWGGGECYYFWLCSCIVLSRLCHISPAFGELCAMLRWIDLADCQDRLSVTCGGTRTEIPTCSHAQRASRALTRTESLTCSHTHREPHVLTSALPNTRPHVHTDARRHRYAAKWQTWYSMLYSVYSFPNILLPFLGGFLVDKLGVGAAFAVMLCSYPTCFSSIAHSRSARCVSPAAPIARVRQCLAS